MKNENISKIILAFDPVSAGAASRLARAEWHASVAQLISLMVQYFIRQQTQITS